MEGNFEASTVEVRYADSSDPDRRVALNGAGLVLGSQLESRKRILLRRGRARFKVEAEDDTVRVTAGGPTSGEGGRQPGHDGHLTVWGSSGVQRVELDGQHGMVHATALVRGNEGSFQTIHLGSGNDLSSMRVDSGALTIAPSVVVGGRAATLPTPANPAENIPVPGRPGTLPDIGPISPNLPRGTDGRVEVHSNLRGVMIALDGGTGEITAKDVALPGVESLVELLNEIKQRLGI